MILDSSVIVAFVLRDPAVLNFGDCLSYAAAKCADHPLLFVGNDFSKTDIEAA